MNLDKCTLKFGLFEFNKLFKPFHRKALNLKYILENSI